MIRGIISYGRKHGPWHLSINARGEGMPVRLPPRWTGEGIIARVATHALANHIRTARAPVINVSAMELKGVELPRVTTDLQAWARLAVEHFLDRGLRHFGYFGLQPLSHARHHRQVFARALADEGYECSCYKPGRGAGSRAGWQIQQNDLVHWLKGLPKPVGILAWPMKRGQQLIDACRWADLLVPEQVAVLVGDEDDLLCDTCNPPLSGIVAAAERVGYEAAALLDRLTCGERPPKKPILIKPVGVVMRRSTDTLAVDDVDLAQAIRFIRDHAADAIQVKDVLRAVPVSRRWLERRFLHVLERTPAAEIRRVHLNRARQLLMETDMLIPDVAAASGFGSPEYMAYAFKSETGLTPQKYRSRGLVSSRQQGQSPNRIAMQGCR